MNKSDRAATMMGQAMKRAQLQAGMAKPGWDDPGGLPHRACKCSTGLATNGRSWLSAHWRTGRCASMPSNA